MERETKKIVTPNDNYEVELLSWLTGGEKRKITNSLLENQEVEMSAASPNFKINSEVLNRAQDVALGTVIVSVNGVKENILETVLNMKSKDFDFIVGEVNKITNEDEEVKKK